MNILYIAPYRNSSMHHECVNHIRSLQNFASVSIYPIYIDSSNIDPEEDILSIESKQNLAHTEYDAVIQHAPIDYLLPFSKDITKQNYCIPIIRYYKCSNQNYSKLLSFDMVLCDSKYDIDFIHNEMNSKTKKIKLFAYRNENIHHNLLNLSYHKDNYKIYTIVNQHNIQYIYNILLAFILVYKETLGCSLIIVADSGDIRSQIDTYIDDIIKKTKINYLRNYIKILSISNTINNVHSVHKSCDCYVECRPHTNNALNSVIAKQYGKTCITNENLDINFEPSVSQNIGYLDQVFGVSSLAMKIKNTIKTKPIHKLNNTPTLDKIICN